MSHKLIIEFASGEDKQDFMDYHLKTQTQISPFAMLMMHAIRRATIKPDDSGELVKALQFVDASLTQPVQYSPMLMDDCRALVARVAILREDCKAAVNQARAALANHAGKGDK